MTKLDALDVAAIAAASATGIGKHPDEHFASAVLVAGFGALDEQDKVNVVAILAGWLSGFLKDEDEQMLPRMIQSARELLGSGS